MYLSGTIHPLHPLHPLHLVHPAVATKIAVLDVSVMDISVPDVLDVVDVLDVMLPEDTSSTSPGYDPYPQAAREHTQAHTHTLVEGQTNWRKI